MPKQRFHSSRYRCDGPDCSTVCTDDSIVLRYWVRMYLPGAKQMTYYHRAECAIAHISRMGNGFDAAAIQARIGEPRPSGAVE